MRCALTRHHPQQPRADTWVSRTDREAARFALEFSVTDRPVVILGCGGR
jgi:hypothetical protein